MTKHRLTDRALDVDTLEILEGVAELGSLSRAAERLGMSQQAASARLAAAERATGLSLLRRSPSGSALTPTGATVLELAEPVLGGLRRLEVSLESLRQPAGALTVAASQTVAELFLPRWLLRLRRHRPDAAVRLLAGNSADVLARIADGSADLGFVEGPSIPAGVSARPLEPDELAVVAAPEHPWACRGSIDARALAEEALLVREEGSGTRGTLEAWLAEQGLGLAEPAAVLGTTAVVRASVLAGVAPAVMSLRTVAAELESGALVRVALE
ncbi:LysR family transcriptional regulator, partial [Rothia sp. AR01]